MYPTSRTPPLRPADWSNDRSSYVIAPADQADGRPSTAYQLTPGADVIASWAPPPLRNRIASDEDKASSTTKVSSLILLIRTSVYVLWRNCTVRDGVQIGNYFELFYMKQRTSKVYNKSYFICTLQWILCKCLQKTVMYIETLLYVKKIIYIL